MNARLKQIRKTLKLTQGEFGEKIGLKQNTVGQIELGQRTLTDRTILLLCSTYNVNENWLRHGGSDTEMFCGVAESSLIAFAKEQGLSKISQSILIGYTKMDEKRRNAFDELLQVLISNVKSESFEKEITEEPPRETYVITDSDKMQAREEAERYYQQLLDEKKSSQ